MANDRMYLTCAKCIEEGLSFEESSMLMAKYDGAVWHHRLDFYDLDEFFRDHPHSTDMGLDGSFFRLSFESQGF